MAKRETHSNDHTDPHRQRFPRLQLATAPFAGRIGGNQEFTSHDDELLKKQPDAAPLSKLSDAIDIRGFLVLETWRQAFIEGLTSCLLIFVLGATASGLTMSNQSAFAQALYGALVSWLGLSLFIYTAAPASGGHINPTVSMSTFFAGLSTLPRSLLYVSAQATGAVIAAYYLRLGLGEENYFPTGVIPGCTVDPATTSVGQMFVLEFLFDQALIFIAFGVGLEPRQAKVFGAAIAPILVGGSLAVPDLASAFIKPGYTGASLNPARCFGLMAAKGDFQYHWVHWAAPFAASIVNGAFYYFAPPYVREKPKDNITGSEP